MSTVCTGAGGMTTLEAALLLTIAIGGPLLVFLTVWVVGRLMRP